MQRSERELERAQLRVYAEDVRKSYIRELRRTQELKDADLATVRTMAAAVEAKDAYTGWHIQRVHALGLLLARAVVPEQAGDPQLAYGLLLHDVGKLWVPDAVLNKPGKLDETEWRLMRQHPAQGVKILSAMPFLGGALDVVRHHHERWDGNGYPDGLQGEEIPLWARMFAIVDTIDAMTSDRPYRRGCALDVAVAELRRGAGTQFDPGCVAAFQRIDPQDAQALLEQRDRSLSRDRGARLAEVRVDGPAQLMPKILIAEDEGSVRSLIRMTLDGGQTEIIEVDNGTVAVEIARCELPELIFLDWSMPGLSGIEVCRALRDDPVTEHINIVMLTARSENRDRLAGFDAGADEYITKPFSPLQLLDTVVEVLGPGALASPL